jgi:hypothetical protein
MPMQILPSRYLVLQYIMNAYTTLHINVPLVCFDGNNVIPFTGTQTSWTGSFDDIGIFVLIPKLIKFFGISVDLGINIFFYGLFYGAFALGVAGLLVLYTTVLQRSVIFFASLLFFKVCMYASDVYIAYCAAIMGTIPLFLYFCEQKTRSLMLFLVIAGLFLGTLQYVRSYSALPALGFICVYLFMHARFDYKKKLYLMVMLFSGVLASKFYFDMVVNEYKDYARVHFDTSIDLPTQHPIWHTIYAGFGFMQWLNVDAIEYDDGCIERMVTKESPSVSFLRMNEYEKIAKNKVLDLFKHQSTFVLMTLFAKLGILLFYLLVSANLGLVAAIFYPKAWQIELAFFVGFSLSTLFPLIAVPISMFSLSFLTFGILYGIISINYFLFHNEKKILVVMKNFFHYCYDIRKFNKHSHT